MLDEILKISTRFLAKGLVCLTMTIKTFKQR